MPTTSAPLPAGRPLVAASASFSATHTISVPGSTLQEFGTVRLAPTGIVIPRDMWVRVRVSGSIRIDADPEWVRRFCNPGPPSECPPPYDGASAGPLGVNDGLEVQVAMNNAYFLWRPRAAGGDGAEDIMWVSAGTRVLAGRAGLWEFGDCWGCTHEPGRAGRYRLTGTQTLTVEEINPLSVRADRTEVDSAEPVGFTARADEEMRNLEWAFVAGDTLPESGPAAALARAGGASFSTSAAAAPAADWDALASCRRKEACTTRVTESGRMWVRGHIEDQIVFARSEIVRVQPVRLKLGCTPNPITRGQSITCTASKDPASAPGELKITGWSFDGVARRDGDVSSNFWAGVMVEGGAVEVRGTIGAQTGEGKAVVRVENRAWTDVLQAPRVAYDVCAVRTNTCLQTPPVEYRDLGKTYLPPFQFALGLQQVAEGPNAGWWYFAGEAGPVVLPQPVTLLHPDVFNAGSDFYRRRSCSPARVQAWITEHEQAHVEIGRIQLEESPINEWIERRRIYRPNGSPSGWYNATRDEISHRMRALMDPEHKQSSRYRNAPCNLRLGDNSQ